MRPDLLQSALADFLSRHRGSVLDQDVGRTLGMLATIARELAHADVPRALYDAALRAAVAGDHVSASSQPRIVMWRRVIRRQERETRALSAAVARAGPSPRRRPNLDV